MDHAGNRAQARGHRLQLTGRKRSANLHSYIFIPVAAICTGCRNRSADQYSYPYMPSVLAVEASVRVNIHTLKCHLGWPSKRQCGPVLIAVATIPAARANRSARAEWNDEIMMFVNVSDDSISILTRNGNVDFSKIWLENSGHLRSSELFLVI